MESTPLLGGSGCRVERTEQSKLVYQTRALAARLVSQQKRKVVSTLLSIVVPLFVVALVGTLQIELDPFLRQGDVKGTIVTGQPFSPTSSAGDLFGYSVNWVVPPEQDSDFDVVLGARNRSGQGYGLLNRIPSAQFAEWSGHGTYTTPSFVIKDREDNIGLEILDAEETVLNTFDASASSAVMAGYTAIVPEGVLYFNALSLADRTGEIVAQYSQSQALQDAEYAYQIWELTSSQEYLRWISFLSSALVGYHRNVSGLDGVGMPFVVDVTTADLPYHALGLSLDISLLVAGFLFPLALTVLLPSFIYAVVSDKESRTREMMKCNGLAMHSYWIVQFVWFFALQLASSIVLVGAGFAFQLRLFTSTPPELYISLLVAWALAAAALSILAASLFDKPRVAVLASYTVILAVVTVGPTLNSNFWTNGRAPLAFNMFPPFALCRGIFLMSNTLFKHETLSSSALLPSHEFGLIVILTVVQSGVCLFLGIYLDTVLPQQYGVRYPVLWPVYSLLRLIKGDEGSSTSDRETRTQAALEMFEEPGSVMGAPMDDAVLVEAERACAAAESLAAGGAAASSSSMAPDLPAIVICNLNKVYSTRTGSGRKHAVKNLSITLSEGEVLGVIGPNGCGKSSTIGCLTGLFPPTHGSAFFFGHELASELETIRSFTGVCPQFSILDPLLTVQESAVFYARIKGVKNVEAHVRDLIAQCGLTGHESKRTSALSGGMARRLSILIALLGDCKICILDEPTTGVSIEEKAAVHEIISDVTARQGKIMIITSHDMHEIELLSSRVCLMSRGQVQCIGSKSYLTTKFGSGYTLVLKCLPALADSVTNAVMAAFSSAQISSEFNGTVNMSMGDDVPVSDMFERMEGVKEAEEGLLDYSISGSSLEEVFISIIRNDEAQNASC